ncbi:hypothetical protein YDYSG_03660 [Paenibacillus tyrfis]|nr:hypothetical protein YDYSG_03660 [Paenibacillus tyrfis]
MQGKSARRNDVGAFSFALRHGNGGMIGGSGLHEPVLPQAEMLAVRDDDMIEQFNPNNFTGTFHPCSKLDIILRWGCVSARMGMGQYNTGAIA